MPNQQWYFVTKIVLTYCHCEKKNSSDREKVLKFEAEFQNFQNNFGIFWHREFKSLSELKIVKSKGFHNTCLLKQDLKPSMNFLFQFQESVVY